MQFLTTVLLLLLLVQASDAFTLNARRLMEQMQAGAGAGAAERLGPLAKLASPLREAARRLATDPEERRRFLLERDYTMVNSLLEVITPSNPLELDAGELEPEFLPRATCEGAGPIEVCVALWIFFQNEQQTLPYIATCHTVSLNFAALNSTDGGMRIAPPIFTFPEDPDGWSVSDWDAVKDRPFVEDPFNPGEYIWNEDFLRLARFQETHFLEIILDNLGLTCSIPIKVIPSTLNSNPTKDTPARTGELTFEMSATLRSRAEYIAGDGSGKPSYIADNYLPFDFEGLPATFESGNVINYTWGLYAPENATEDTNLTCSDKAVINDITFSASGLENVIIEIPLNWPLPDITVVNRPLDTELPDALNDESNPNRDSAVGPITDILCNLTSTLGDLVVGLVTNLTWATDPEAFLQLNESLPLEEALRGEASLLPVRPGSKLVDLGDNFISDLLGLFPDADSPYIGGNDPENAPVTDLLLGFADVTVPEGEEPLFYIVDALFNTSLVEQIQPQTPIDPIAIIQNLTNGAFNLSETDGRLEFGFAIEAQEEIPAFLVNISVGKITVLYTPRDDAPVEERFFLEQIRRVGPYTLQLPTFRFGDLEIVIEDIEFLVTFFGGGSLLDPDTPDSEREVFELLLQDIAGFVIPSATPDYVTGTAVVDRVQVDWNDFWGEASVMLPVDITKFELLELGPLLENIADCALSIFYETPRLTGFRVNGESMGIPVIAYPDTLDGVIILALEFVQGVIPMFQGAVPYVLEGAVNTSWINQELFEPWVCPRAVETPGREFFFNGTFWDSAQEYITEDLFFTLMDAVFPKGDTPQTENYNQLIAEPAELIKFTNVPSSDGLNITVEFVLTRIEMGGLSPGNFTQFELLRINQTFQQFVETELDLGIPQNPVFLHIDFEINTLPSRGIQLGTEETRRQLDLDDEPQQSNWWDADSDWALGRSLQGFLTPRPTAAPTPTPAPTQFPSVSPTGPQPTTSPNTQRPTFAPTQRPTQPLVNGQAINRVRLDVNFESVYVLIDLWLRFYAYDIESTTLNETTSFSCWMAKLQPFGGPSALAARLGEQGMSLTCEYCTTPVIQSLADRFNNPQATSELFDFINQVLDYAAEALLNLFSEDEWEFNNRNFQRACDGQGALERPSEIGEFSEDLGDVFVFMGFTVMALTGLGCTTCWCIKAPHEQKRTGLKDAGKVAGMEKDPFPDHAPSAGAGGPLAFLENVDNKEHMAYELEHQALWNHNSVPVWVRFVIPFLLLLNLVLFIIGHVGQAVSVSIVASIAGIPIELNDFQQISVLKSVELLFSSGGILLGILILVVSVIWPYCKILGMGISWFLPTRFLNFHKRGTVIKRLDQLGKWSLIELYFLLFVVLSFRISVTSPETTFLPAGFYFLRMEITPQFSIYAFCTALVISLATSNAIGVYHEKVEKQMIHVLREPRKGDEFAVSLTDYGFPVTEQTATLRLTGLAVTALTLFCLTGIMLLVISASMPALGAETVGLAGFVTKLEGRDTLETYSLFRFFEIIYGSGSAGELYLGTVFTLTVLVVPLLQLMGILYLLLGRFTLAGAINAYELNQFLCAWACVEVFVVGIGVVILEVGQISGGISGGACEFLRDPMETYILPLGLIDEVDVQNTCFAMLGSLLPGAYVMFFAIIVSNIAHYSVTIAFQKMIVSRIDVHEVTQKHATSKIGHKVAHVLERIKMLRRGDNQRAVAF